MADFEMIVVDGVRYRPEDAKALGLKPEARTLAGEIPTIKDGAEFVEGAQGEDPNAAAADVVESFDPTDKKVEEVLAELSRVREDADEVARIKAAEEAGKGRVTITEWEPTE